MARLASEEKMGYYPTPERVVEKIKEMLLIPPGARLIDTCCGEGDALEIIADGTESITYGVELDRGRAAEARKKLDHVLCCDSLNELICSRKTFSLLFLNPPYDREDEGEEGKGERLELIFLRKHFPLLQKEGLLVLVIPERVLIDCLDYLKGKCSKVDVFSFPSNYYWEFRQVVLFAMRGKPENAISEMIEKAYESRLREALYVFPELDRGDVRYQLPGPDEKEVIFESRAFDPDQAVEVVKKSPLWKEIIPELTHTKGCTTFRPLMPLREGHLAMLLAGGFMDGEVDDFIIKGSVRKVLEEREEETETEIKRITTQRYEVTVRAIRTSSEPEIIEIT